MWFSFFLPALLSCKNIIFKGFHLWHRVQNRAVCKQLMSHCTLSFTSDDLSRLIGQMWACKKHKHSCTSPDLGPNTSSPSLEAIFLWMSEKKWVGCHLCLFSIALFLVEHKLPGYVFGYCLVPDVFHWPFTLTWSLSKGLGLTTSPQWSRAMRI